MRFAILLPALVLAGCGLSPEYRARQAAAREAQLAALNDREDATCLGYGVQRGSQPYVNCRMNLANNRALQGAVDRQAQAVEQANYVRMMAVGASMMH